MSSKRDLDDVDEGEISEPQTKRPRKQNATTRQHQHSHIDATSGQKYVFSNTGDGTTIPAGEESDFEDDADAMAYLRSVRQEASGIPNLLVAPKVQIGPQLPADLKGHEDDDDEPVDRSIYTDGIGDSRGYYEDGAYIARPEHWEQNAELDDGEASEDEDIDPAVALQNSYFAAIMDQYLHLRTILNSEPPPDASSRLSSSHVIYADPFGQKSHTIGTWSRLLRTTDPHPLQLALMSKDSVLRIIRVLLSGKFLRSGHSLPERTSRWLWALLARLPDRGQLNHLDMGWVRDLGRRAVLLGRSLAEMAALREELEEGGLGVNEGVDASSSDEDVVAQSTSDEFEPADSSAEKAEAPSPPKLAVPHDSTADNPKAEGGGIEAEEGEVSEEGEEDVAMDLASDSEDEVTGEPKESLEAVKSRLLARLDDATSDVDEAEAAQERSRMNMRATLNMILTVAGEFYGQRDLLEFREPFVGM